MKYKVTYDRSGCIGAGTCVAAHEKRWQMNDDGKADFLGAESKGEEQFELIIEEEELQKMKDAAEACPVNVIHIEDETGKKII